MANNWDQVPDWDSWENQGGGIAAADLDGDGRPELIVLRVDHPTPGPNRGFYRIGKALDAEGHVTGGWGLWVEVPDWGSQEGQGAALAVGDLDGDGRPELVVFQIEHRVPGPNRGLYRVGKGLDSQGNVTGGWGAWIEVPNWNSWEDQGAGIALGDLDGDGRPELAVFHIDDFHTGNPTRPNKGLYRVGRAVDADGHVTGGWGDWIEVDWFSWFNQGGGLALADLDGNDRPELIVFQVDNPPGLNGGFYRIGWNLDAGGSVRDGWGHWVPVPNWVSWEDQGGGFALADLAGGTRPKALVFHIDNPPGLNAGLFRADDLVVDLDEAAEKGLWRLLPYFSEVLPVHAALLHTNKVLFFAGSGNNAFRFQSQEFGDEARRVYTSVVWDFEKSDVFDHPPTLRRPGPDGRPIDFFCCGHCFLPDGRILVIGGTEDYDLRIQNGVPVDTGHGFIGLKDALIFDPAAETWSPVATMADGRWYPTAIPLGDGTVIAASGMIAGNHTPPFSRKLEHLADPDHGPWTVAGSIELPLYPHLFLLRDGRLFFSGGRMDSDDPIGPRIFDPEDPGRQVPVANLRDAGSRNQSASVLLPPAQDQRVLIMGGAPEDSDETPRHPATAKVDVIDLKAAAPAYTPAADLMLSRIHVNAVILPDRTVLATGGAEVREASEQGRVITPIEIHERREPELYDPAQDRWTEMARATVARLYHSVALLLPDGRVVAAGGNPDKGSQVAWLPPDPREELRLEIFSPPYLFRGARPVIDDAPEDVRYGATIAIGTRQAGQIRWVNLIRPGLTTHSFNVEQRLVDVPFQPGPNVLKATLTDNPNLAPPGWYLLFLTDTKGIPSVGRWIQLMAGRPSSQLT